MKIHCFIFILVITFLLPCLSHSAIFCVSDATELQNALTTASNNGEDDTVQIEQGTYVGNFIYASTEVNNLTVEGGYTSGCASRDVDPANTILDGDGSGNVLVLSTPDSNTNLEIDGLTLQNGISGNKYGGGIYANTEGDVTISNNTITNNSALFEGGGIYAYSYSGSIIINDNTISNNTADLDYGGGIKAHSSSGSIIINDNTITENTTFDGGGGVYAASSLTTFTNNTISNNTVGFEGGGVYISYGLVTFTGNTIMSNTAREGGGVYATYSTVTFINNTISANVANYPELAAHGGGVYATYSTVTFINNTINSNLVTGTGGGVCVYSSSSSKSVTFTNNTIMGNTAEIGSGGGVHVTGDSISFTNNTISINIATVYGGGIYASSSSGSIIFYNNTITGNLAFLSGGGCYIYLSKNDALANIVNNIIWNNAASNSANDFYVVNDGNGDFLPSMVTLFNNDFDHSESGIYIEIPFSIDPSNINNENPLFQDAQNGDLHISDLSPCIDTGRLDGSPADDMDGEPRPMGFGVDIGADEYTSFIPTTTSSSTTTTAEPTTSSTSSSTTTSIEPTTSSSSSSSTTSSIPQPPPNTTTSVETTSSSTSTSATTTTEPTTTTTSILADCMLYISISPPMGGTTSPAPPQYFVMGCQPVTVEALPNPGYKFSHWEGDAQGSDNPITIESVGTLSITAVFVIDLCPSEAIYGEQSEETELLRYFRDNVLSQTPEGQELIKLYYQWSPSIVKAMEGDEEFKEEIKEMIDGVLPLIRGVE